MRGSGRLTSGPRTAFVAGPPSAERALLSRLFRSMESSALGSAEQRDLEPRSGDRRWNPGDAERRVRAHRSLAHEQPPYWRS